MAIGKEEFVDYITNAIVEAKHIHDASKTKEKGEYNKYVQKMSQDKVEKLYSTIREVIENRVIESDDKEIEKYRELKLNEINSEINKCMIVLENSDLAIQKNIQERIEKLMKKQSELKDKFEEIKSNNTLDKIYKDRDTLDKFFGLVEEYKDIKSELKMLQAERFIIAKDLVPENMDYIDVTNLLSDDRLNNLESVIRRYIIMSQSEEENEKNNFSSKAKKVYFSTLQSDEKPISLKVLNVLKDKIEKHSPRIYEKAVLQIEELDRLNSKTFKTDEVNNRINELKYEIGITKSEINKIIRDSYKDYYAGNNVYKPNSTRINGKFIYELGYENLNDFFEFGIWPADEQIESLRVTRKLNQKEAEKAIIRIELVKSKYTSLYNEVVQNKEARLVLIEDKLTKLVGNWKTDDVSKLINSHLEDKQVGNRKSK